MAADNPTPQVTIEVTENGPLIVKGLKKVQAASGQAIACKDVAALCRCGHSGNKPFCDGTHKKVGFRSERENKRTLHRERPYEGEKITIYDNRTICAHAAICVSQLPAVFRKNEQPWIEPDGADAATTRAIIDRCPSGALRYAIESGKSTGLGQEDGIVIEQGGPYHVTGNVRLQVDEALQPPLPAQYTLCRCGASKNKPYCDGSHYDVAFDTK